MLHALRSVARTTAFVALAALCASDAPRANHFILPCGDTCMGGRWELTGSLNTARAYHTATLLPSGKVLVVGGTGLAGEALDSAEIYDPATAMWSVTSSLNTPRTKHTATLLQDGRVLVVGGASSDDRTAELYDPDTGGWSMTGSLAWPHTPATATLLEDGRVLIVGTPDFDPRHAAELYDPSTGSWSPAAQPGWGRTAHTATLLRDGRVLVFGGIVGSYDADIEFPPDSRPELFDPVSEAWLPLIPWVRANDNAATLLPDGNVLLAGGWLDMDCALLELAGIATPYPNPGIAGGTCSTAYAAIFYDQATREWSARPKPPVARAGHTVTPMPDGSVLVAGGNFFPDDSFGAELYDPATSTWRGAATMIAWRAYHTATLLPNGEVLVAGGLDRSAVGATPQATAELYAVSEIPAGSAERGRHGF